MSLREVENDVLLQLRPDDPSWTNAPAWDFGEAGPDGASTGDDL